MYDFEMLGVEEEADEGLRGREYDLRITFAPVDWMKVLNSFALDLVTYVIFYVMLGIGVCLFVTVVVRCIRSLCAVLSLCHMLSNSSTLTRFLFIC